MHRFAHDPLRATGRPHVRNVRKNLTCRWGPWVVGIDGDYSWANLKGTSVDIGVVATPPVATLTDKIDWVATATATGRAGYAMNNWLFFVKGGGAWAGFKASTTVASGTTGATVANVTAAETRSGWTAGVGVEWAVTTNWLVKAEYDYIDFGTTNFNATNVTIPGGVATVFARSATSSLNIGKVGAAYKF